MLRTLFIFGFVCLFWSCTKDRFPPLNSGGEPGEEISIYAWDFNDQNSTQISAPSIYIGASELTYDGAWDYSDGTLLNALPGTVAGSSLRLRNPAGSFVIQISTTGFEKLKLSYAAMRTNSGAQENLFSYSLDGVNYFESGIDPQKQIINLDFELKQVDFSSINALNNKEKVYIKIDFNVGSNNSSGNNRFDNLVFRATNI